MNKLDRRLVQVVPSARQLALQRMEMYAFVHFTVNTFTDREWGDGTESPLVFDPSRLNAGQWMEAIRSAGMSGVILTCKHHDGFCLWPSQYTQHTVAASPYRGGNGDVVREVADACRRAGLRFGVYLSPWDRHSVLYGTGKPYDDFFVAQLTELLTDYGEIFSVWFDGACGEGQNGRKQLYDWDRYYRTIRSLQPNACIHVCGPDIRWCGNEARDTRPYEWSVVPRRTMDTEKIASASQQADDAAFRQRKIRAQDRDLGSREMLADEANLVWYPAEVNTSIRPGWFWHPSENGQVRPLDELINIYERSVGGNATFLLNIPPTTEGLLHETDVERLHEFGRYLKDAYGRNLLHQPGVVLTASDSLPGCEISAVLTDSYDEWYMPSNESDPVEIHVRWDQPQSIRRIVLKENILYSQRVEQFAIDAEMPDGWQEMYTGTVIGYKRIVVLPEITTTALRIRITDARCAPTVSFLAVYPAVR